MARHTITRVDIGRVPQLPARSCNSPGQRDRFNARDRRRIGAFGFCVARRAARHRRRRRCHRRHCRARGSEERQCRGYRRQPPPDHSGPVNAHTHSHGGLSKGVGDLWQLDLLLNAAPWIGGSRSQEDKHLSTLIHAVEHVEKGSTACYDLFFEFPAPSIEGMEAVANAYAKVGLRAVIAPMVADLTFYQATGRN